MYILSKEHWLLRTENFVRIGRPLYKEHDHRSLSKNITGGRLIVFCAIYDLCRWILAFDRILGVFEGGICTGFVDKWVETRQKVR